MPGFSDTEFSGVWDVNSAHLGLEFSKTRRDMVIRNLASAADEFGFKDID